MEKRATSAAVAVATKCINVMKSSSLSTSLDPDRTMHNTHNRRSTNTIYIRPPDSALRREAKAANSDDDEALGAGGRSYVRLPYQR